MAGQSSANQNVIQDDYELFASAEHLGQVLTASSSSSSILVRVHEGRPFFSVVRINDLLSSFTTDWLQIVERQDEAGHESLALRLVDSQGDEVPTLAGLRQGEWAMHSSRTSTCGEDEQQACDDDGGGDDDDQGPPFEEDCIVVRHDTPINGLETIGQLDQHGRDHSPHMHHYHEDNSISDEAPNNFVSPSQVQHSNEDYNGFDEASDLIVSPTMLPESRPKRMEPPSTETERGSTQIVLPHRTRCYDDAVVRKLRELKITDLTILDRLLENRSPLALSPLAKTRDEFVHLCTLENGKTFVVKMLRDLHAHSAALELANLNDPELLDRQLTGYQRNELSRILTDIEKTACAQQFWSSAHLVPRPRRKDYIRIIPKREDITWKVYNEYETMRDFKHEIELLLKNVELFHGSDHEVTAAAERTVQEILTRMGEAAAVGIQDHRESLFNGLVREVSLSEGTLLSFADWSPLDHVPKFVLPLGKLYTTTTTINPQSFPPDNQEPLFCSGFVLMDVSNPRKAIWLYHNGPERSYLVMLADDITRWKLSSSSAVPGGPNHEGGLMKGHHADVRRTKLTKEHRESRIDFPPGAVLFKRASKTQLTKVVKEGWSWGQKEAPSLPQEGLVTTPRGGKKKRRGAPDEEGSSSSAARRKNRRICVWNSDEEEEEEWIPATEHRKSNKNTTPTNSKVNRNAPRTV